MDNEALVAWAASKLNLGFTPAEVAGAMMVALRCSETCAEKLVRRAISFANARHLGEAGECHER
jgi:hypothetical protein